jgi:hypothetical protein
MNGRVANMMNQKENEEIQCTDYRNHFIARNKNAISCSEKISKLISILPCHGKGAIS